METPEQYVKYVQILYFLVPILSLNISTGHRTMFGKKSSYDTLADIVVRREVKKKL